MASISTISTAAAYSTKDNILVPPTEGRTAAALQTQALADLQTEDATATITAAHLPVKTTT